jgi:ribosomal protein S18 acetylase RimI-like enzyme
MAVMSNSHLVTPPGGEALVCRRARLGELPVAVGMMLGSPHRPAPVAQVTEFINSAASRRIDVETIWVAEAAGKIVWAVLPILNPGKTLLILTSSDTGGTNIPAARLIGDICRHYARHGVELAQVLLESKHHQSRRFFTSLGFNEIAELIYLQGNVPRNMAAPEISEHMRWLEYSPATHPIFAQAITETYRDSLDCPALSGLREIDDVIAGHRATGEFDPAGWHLLLEDDHPLGVVLLSRIPQTDAMELVYLGLSPEARGKGLGTILMRQVFFLIMRNQRRRLSLAVDSKNDPALKLYYRFGMQQVATRWAMICRLCGP